jgi:phosphate transport system permease protein
MLAPRSVRAIVGPLVEMLAAIPSVVLGFWGVIVLAPFVQKHVEPFLHTTFGFLGIFGPPQTTGLSIFTAGLILTIMVVPIIASLSRDLFLTVPRELKEGAEALGATRWEVIRGVVLPTTVSGVAAATVLGLGRALGEAIAVAQVIGDGSVIHKSVFEPGSTLASKIAVDFPNTISDLHQSSLFYLALILLAIGVATSLTAQAIASRFDATRLVSR